MINREIKKDEIKKDEIKTIGTFSIGIGDGGIEKVTTLLIDQWVSFGYNVILFTEQAPLATDYHINNKAVRIVLPRESKNTFARKKTLSNAIKEYGVEVMIYHAWCCSAMGCDMEICKTNQIPFVTYVHGVFSAPFRQRGSHTSDYIWNIKKSDLVLCLSEESRIFYNMLGIKTRIVRNPLDPKILQTGCAELKGKKILWIGRLEPDKKPLEAVYIFREVKKRISDAHMLFVGNGSMKRKIEGAIKECDLVDCIDMVGYTNDVESFYRDAAVVLFTSDFEGAPMVLLESKAYGIPCVMYNIPYVEMCKNPIGIDIVPQNDRSAAAYKIICLLQDINLRKRKGQMARESLESIYKNGLVNDWNAILGDAQMNEEKVEPSSNTLMLETLLDHEEHGIAQRLCEIHSSLTWRIGNGVLAFPKYLFGLFEGKD